MVGMERRETERVEDYLRESGLLGGGQVYVGPEVERERGGYLDVAGDTPVDTSYTDEGSPVDVAVAWPAAAAAAEGRELLRSSPRPGYWPIPEGVKHRMGRGQVRDTVKRSNERVRDDGALLVRIDDFETRGIAGWLDGDTDPDVTETVAFYLQSPFGFEEVYQLDETTTGRSYLVGERPRRD